MPVVEDFRLRLAFEAIERAHGARSQGELEVVMAETLKAFGISHFAVDQMRDDNGELAGLHHFGRRNEDWGVHYLSEAHYLHDRVVKRALQGPSPVRWSEAQKDGPALEVHEKRLFGEAREFGLRDGFITPVHSSKNGSVLSVTLTADEPLGISLSDEAALRLISLYYCSYGLALKRQEQELQRPHLSPRQRECLQWVRAGKSSADISTITGIVERTVNFHIGEACRRLGVRTRQQAVIEAIRLGLIAL